MALPSQNTSLIDDIGPIADILAAYSVESDYIRKVPDEIINILASKGFFKMKLSSELGGLETDIITYMDVIEEISRIDSSVGWNTMIGNSSIGWPGSFLDDQATSIIFKDKKVPLASSVMQPSGKAIPVESGYLLTGEWLFSSGIEHSEWVLAGFTISNETPFNHRIACIRKNELTVHDDWKVMGLQGTGSCSYSTSNLFVPSSFTWSMTNDEPIRGGAINYLGRPGFVTMDHAAFALGVAKKALETIIEISKTKIRGYNTDRKNVSERDSFKRDLGLAQTKLAAARALVKETHLKAWKYCEQKQVPPPMIQSEMRNACVFATETSEEVAHMAFKYGGGTALYLHNNLQKYFRDLSASAQHMMVNNSSYENYANFLLDIEGADPMGLRAS